MAVGTAEIDFGAFPGKTDVDLVVTGQAAIVAGSSVEAWIRPAATVEHSADEHTIAPISVMAHTIVAGTGFTIRTRAEGLGAATRLYGRWSVSWAWV